MASDLRDSPRTSEKTVLGRNIVLPHAQRLVELLRSVCERVEIAGSLRREKDTVSDVEIVVLPLRQSLPSLFDEPAPYAPCEEFGTLLRSLQGSGLLRLDPDKPRNGPLYKRFLLPALTGPGYEQGFGCDLFLADPDNWGNTLAIRTGSAAFSKLLMSCAWTRKRRRQQDGYLWQCLPGDAYEGGVPEGRNKIVCATEQDYFDAVGVPFVPPWYRTSATAEQMRREGR